MPAIILPRDNIPQQTKTGRLAPIPGFRSRPLAFQAMTRPLNAAAGLVFNFPGLKRCPPHGAGLGPSENNFRKHR